MPSRIANGRFPFATSKNGLIASHLPRGRGLSHRVPRSGRRGDCRQTRLQRLAGSHRWFDRCGPGFHERAAPARAHVTGQLKHGPVHPLRITLLCGPRSGRDALQAGFVTSREARASPGGDPQARGSRSALGLAVTTAAARFSAVSWTVTRDLVPAPGLDARSAEKIARSNTVKLRQTVFRLGR